MDYIKDFNLNSGNIKLGLGPFTDLTNKEYSKIILNSGFQKAHKSNPKEKVEISDNFDWRDTNSVTPVKSIGQTCKSDYVFTAIEALETEYNISYGHQTVFSTQQYIDCSDRNDTCENSNIKSIWSYLNAVQNIESDANYTYIGKKMKCDYKRELSAFSFGKIYYEYLNTGENYLYNVIQRPIVVFLNFTPESLQHYKSGIYDILEECDGNLDHYGLLVGYGIENNVTYWIIKNNFGSNWGEKGYIRLIRGRTMCGIGKNSYHISL